MSVRPRGKLLVQFDVQFRIQKVNGKFEAKLGELKNMGVISSCEKQKLDKKISSLFDENASAWCYMVYKGNIHLHARGTN